MVECELHQSRIKRCRLCRFNRYMVECEFNLPPFQNLSDIVLIDTWWNVNYKTKVTTSKTASVLIDTWWNVNDFFTSEIENLLNVLIDTWWNVNFDVEDDEVQETEGFNRYLV